MHEGVSLALRSVLYIDDRICVSGIYRESPGQNQAVFVATYDTLGDLLWSDRIVDDSAFLAINAETNVARINDRDYLLKYGFIGKNAIGVALISSNGEIKEKHEFAQDNSIQTIPRDIACGQSACFMTGTFQHPDFQVDAFIMKLTPDGDSIWMRTYGHPVYWERSRTITQVNENEYVISGSRNSGTEEPGFSHGWAMAVDSLGNVLWEWEASKNEIPYGQIKSMGYDFVNHEWVYVSHFERQTTFPGEDYEVMVPILVRRDTNMNLISYEEYGPYAINHYMGAIEPSHDGGWIAAGSYTTTTDDYMSPIRSQSGRVMKLSADGTLEWSVIDTAFFHPELGSRSYLSGVTESPAGSVYAVGWADNYDENNVYRSFGWLLKITADGCVDTLCSTNSILEEMVLRQHQVVVWPNPAHDFVTVKIAEDLNEEINWTLYSIAGQSFFSTEIQDIATIELNQLPSGIYFWTAIGRNGQLLRAGKLILD